MPKKVFVDTWGWVALGHHRDSRHKEVRDFFQQLRSQNAQIFTSDYILDETITLLFRREHFGEAIRFMEGIFAGTSQNILTVEKVSSTRFTEAWKFRLKFQDKPLISFTDLTSMVILKELDIKMILTDDDHFTMVGMGFQKVP